MTARALLPLTVIVVLAIVWLCRNGSRRIKTQEQIIELLHPGETDDLEEFAADGIDFLGEDSDFVAASKGWEGLKRKRHNAVLIVQFCQQLRPSSQIDKEQIRLVGVRAIVISFLVACHILEVAPRVFMKSFPHVSARVATKIYWDMERRATTLCSIYRPDLLDQLHQIL